MPFGTGSLSGSTGIWQRRGRWIVNTGSFMPPGAAWCVDSRGNQLDVRRVEWRGMEFVPGRLVPYKGTGSLSV